MTTVVPVAADDVDPDHARRVAHDILGSGPARSSNPPRPLRGVLRWIGDRLAPVGRALEPVGRFLESPGGIVLLAVLVALVVVWVARRSAARRVARATSAMGKTIGLDTTELDPDALERAADDAEARGELDLALRLRFRAGLGRLDAVGAIRFAPSVTTGQVARRLRSARFDDLATTFDAVAYGGRPADPPDLAAARREWPRVVAESRSG